MIYVVLIRFTYAGQRRHQCERVGKPRVSVKQSDHVSAFERS